MRALRESQWVLGGPGGAAERLGLKRTTLFYKMRKLGITRQPRLTRQRHCVKILTPNPYFDASD